MSSIKASAHRAGVLYVLLLVAGLVDMFGFSGFLVPGDPVATARNIMTGELTYRIGIGVDFATLVIFILLLVSLYKLLKGVDERHAMLMVVLVSVGVAIGLANLVNKIAPLILLSGAGYLAVFSQPQLNALALGFLSLNDHGNAVDTLFWGLWLFPFGILVVKSGFLPRLLGILLMVAGVGYLARGATSIVSPAYGDVVSRATMPLVFGEFPIIFWLLIRGAKVPQPQAR